MTLIGVESSLVYESASTALFTEQHTAKNSTSQHRSLQVLGAPCGHTNQIEQRAGAQETAAGESLTWIFAGDGDEVDVAIAQACVAHGVSTHPNRADLPKLQHTAQGVGHAHRAWVAERQRPWTGCRGEGGWATLVNISNRLVSLMLLSKSPTKTVLSRLAGVAMLERSPAVEEG